MWANQEGGGEEQIARSTVWTIWMAGGGEEGISHRLIRLYHDVLQIEVAEE